MKMQRVVAVLRHNTHLGGDLRLACREFDALMGMTGEAVADRGDLSGILGNSKAAAMAELSPNGSVVARLYRDAPSEAVWRLLRKGAFVQEVFAGDEDDKRLDRFVKNCPMPSMISGDLSGRIAVALSQAYIVESEAVLDKDLMIRRMAQTAELLLEPYGGGKPSPKSLKLRRAKKTTLSLSHDLHVYKAKFFPRMVRALLNIFGRDGARVLDPYCGSGTALLEASLLGMESHGTDVDPICHLISRTKVTPFVRKSSLSNVLVRFEGTLGAVNGKRADFAFPNELRAKLERRDRIDDTSYLPEILDETSQLATALDGLRREHPEEELLFTLASDAVTKKIRYRFVGVGNGKYTIEIVRQTLLSRMKEKVARSRQLASVFAEITSLLDTKLGKVNATLGDARDRSSWPINDDIDIIVTSPPYLPASSGREHYAASRALAFSLLGYKPGEDGYFDTATRIAPGDLDLDRFPESKKLMTYLESDASDDADPQRDAMRFERKAVPTFHYLGDMRTFLDGAAKSLSKDGVLLLVVAHHHTFYSHRRKELEHLVSCRNLYSELAADVGLVLEEEIEMELMKAATSRARPMAKEDYYESVLVFRPSSILPKNI